MCDEMLQNWFRVFKVDSQIVHNEEQSRQLFLNTKDLVQKVKENLGKLKMLDDFFVIYEISKNVVL